MRPRAIKHRARYTGNISGAVTHNLNFPTQKNIIQCRAAAVGREETGVRGAVVGGGNGGGGGDGGAAAAGAACTGANAAADPDPRPADSGAAGAAAGAAGAAGDAGAAGAAGAGKTTQTHPAKIDVAEGDAAILAERLTARAKHQHHVQPAPGQPAAGPIVDDQQADCTGNMSVLGSEPEQINATSATSPLQLQAKQNTDASRRQSMHTLYNLLHGNNWLGYEGYLQTPKHVAMWATSASHAGAQY
eukprot:363331-Chlamydomonas_euryale.AAC.10